MYKGALFLYYVAITGIINCAFAYRLLLCEV